MLITEKIVDLKTGQETLVEKEIDPKDLAEFKAHNQAVAETAAEAATKEAARQTVLEKLGLTADEATALLG